MIGGVLTILATLAQPVANTSALTVTLAEGDKPQQLAVSFMDQYFRHLSSPDVLNRFEDDYAGFVLYFGKVVSKKVVMREKAAFVRRWPKRSYRPRENSFQVGCRIVDNESVCSVKGLVDYECQNSGRHTVASGVARFTADIWISKDGLEIIGEKSAALR